MNVSWGAENILARELKACKDLVRGKSLHHKAVEFGCHRNESIGTALVSMYSRCHRMNEARQAFEGIITHTPVSWAALVRGYVENDDLSKALETFTNMNCEPDRAALLAIVKACTSLRACKKRDKKASLDLVVNLHTKAQDIGVDQELPVANTFVSLFSKCADMASAKRVFDNILHRNVVSWTALMQGYVENGQSKIALDMFNCMDCVPNRVTCLAAAKACACLATQNVLDRKACLQRGIRIHERIKELGHEMDISVANTLVGMYSRCGDMSLAMKVFEGIVQPDVVSWSALILGYVENMECQVALEIFHKMDCAPNSITFLAAIKACATLASKKMLDKMACLEKGLRIHQLARECKADKDISVANALIDMYGRCGDMTRAEGVFNKIVHLGDVVSWNTIIQGYVENGDACLALEMFGNMNCAPNKVTILGALKACGALEMDKTPTLQKLLAVHTKARMCGLEKDLFVGNSLVNVYSRYGDMRCAREVFDGMAHKDNVSWSSLVLGYVENGESQVALDVYNSMDCAPNTVAFAAAVRAYVCLASTGEISTKTLLQKARELERQAVDCGFDKYLAVANALMDIYIRSGDLRHARNIFDKMDQCSVASWNTLLLGYAQNNDPLAALMLFDSMSLKPNSMTFVAASKACASLAGEKQSTKQACIEKGKNIHKRYIACGFPSDVYVATSLVEMYSKCGDMVLAQIVFDSVVKPDVVLWSGLIRSFVENGESLRALELFEAMDAEPDIVVFLAACKACASLVVENKMDGASCVRKGQWIHKQARVCGLDKELVVSNILVDMYSKLGEMKEARCVFDAMQERDVVSWNALILGYVRNEESFKALQVFDNMDCVPNRITFIAILKACAGLAVEDKLNKTECLEKGLSIHKQLRGQGLEQDILVSSTLVDMYSKFGDMTRARMVFDNMTVRDVIAWTTLILGYVVNGQSTMALQTFSLMDVDPDPVTFIAVLKACANLGALENGKAIHDQVRQFGLEQNQMVASSLIDFYGKSGDMSTAEEVFGRMHFHDTIAWSTLLGGYSMAGDTIKMLRTMERMRELGVSLNSVTFLSILMACSYAGMVQEGQNYFNSMSRHGITPEARHYACLVDILGRANRIQEALRFAKTTPFEENTEVWTTLLAACKECSNKEVGKIAFDELAKKKHTEATTYILMRSIYEMDGL